MKKLLLLLLLFVVPAQAALTIGITKDITINGVPMPNAFAKLVISNTTGNKFNCTLRLYYSQAVHDADPENFIKTLNYTVTMSALQHETINNTLYSMLIAQISALNGATQVN